MDTGTLLIALIRPIERLLAVGIGGFSIYLGYRLFQSLPDRTDSEGHVILPGGVDVRLSRIGPGAFFALFGAAVVGFALSRAVRVEAPAAAQAPVAVTQPTQPPQAGAPQASAAVIYGGMGEAPAPRSELSESALAELRRDLHDLNSLVGVLREDADAKTCNELGIAIQGLAPKIKLGLLQRSWSPTWGDFGRFEQWVRAGARDPVPEVIAQPAALFRRGSVPSERAP